MLADSVSWVPSSSTTLPVRKALCPKAESGPFIEGSVVPGVRGGGGREGGPPPAPPAARFALGRCQPSQGQGEKYTAGEAVIHGKPPVTDWHDYTSGWKPPGQYFLGSAPSIEGRLKLNPYGIPVCYSFSHQTFLQPRCFPMPRMVRCGLIQARNVLGVEHSLGEIRDAMVRKHVEMIEQAAQQKVQILCLQELFYGPYFCAEQDARWYEMTETVPDGPTVRLMQELAAKHHMVIVVPVYEQEMA